MTSNSGSTTDIAITFSPTSPHLNDPPSLLLVNPALSGLQHAGPVGPGAMADVHVFAVKDDERTEVVNVLKAQDGVIRVDVLEKKLRKKRDEF